MSEPQEFWDLEQELIRHIGEVWADGTLRQEPDTAMMTVWVRSFVERIFQLGSRVVTEGLAKDLDENDPYLGARLQEFLER